MVAVTNYLMSANIVRKQEVFDSNLIFNCTVKLNISP